MKTNNAIKYIKNNVIILNVNEITADTIFYARKNGKVVACKFTSLEVYHHDNYRTMDEGIYSLHGFNTWLIDNYGYAITYADGTTDGGAYRCLPHVYTTIEDAISDTNDLFTAKVEPRDIMEHFGFDMEERTEVGGNLYPSHLAHQVFYAWRWDASNLKAVYKPISFHSFGIKYDVLAKRPTKKVYYSTIEECRNANAIEVITF